MTFYNDSKDRYNDQHVEPPEPCKHGNGKYCECQFGWYAGLYVVPIDFSHDGKRRHFSVVGMKQCHDGGMREFIDPQTGETVGCCGLHFGRENVKSLEDYTAYVTGPAT